MAVPKALVNTINIKLSLALKLEKLLSEISVPLKKENCKVRKTATAAINIQMVCIRCIIDSRIR